LTGPIGTTGSIGTQGQQGLTGGLGLQGLTGLLGGTGIQGVMGVDGTTGEKGATGIKGVTGQRGFTGIGILGPPGPIGETGLTGYTGVPGETGAGVQGDTGAGVTGLMGSTGVQGIAGTTGPQGLARTSYNWTISDSAGLIVGTYIVYFAMESVTIEEVVVTMINSGTGGTGATHFEFYKLGASILPTSPPVGIGDFTVIIPAAGVTVMNGTKVTSLALSLAINESLVVGISAAPATPGNNALVSIRALL
jgi:hypothetical protein